MPEGWNTYEKLVLHELEALKGEVSGIDEKLTLLRIDVAQLKVKAGIWGATAGMMPALITAIAAFTGGLK